MAERIDTLTVISRKEAIERGLKHFYTGAPCRRGHLEKRLVANAGCVECSKLALRISRSKRRDKCREWDRKYRKDNLEKIRAQERNRYAKNPSKFIEKTKKYYYNNVELVKKKSLDRYYRVCNEEWHREQVRKRTKNWAKRNPDRVARNVKASRHARRAKEKGAVGRFNANDLVEIFNSQKGKCAYCRSLLGKKPHVDHITPLALGGTNFRNNLQFLCGPCNLRKGARDPVDHARLIGMLI